jgi:hypothetical protein
MTTELANWHVASAILRSHDHPTIEQARKLIKGQEEFIEKASHKVPKFIPDHYSIRLNMFKLLRKEDLMNQSEDRSELNAHQIERLALTQRPTIRISEEEKTHSPKEGLEDSDSDLEQDLHESQ